MNDDYDFTGKVALVTGSSRGIGAGLVAAFDRRGARCVVNYVADPAGRNLSDAKAVAGALRDAMVVQADVGDAEQVAAMLEQVRNAVGGLDFLVNNAGILRDRSLKRMSADEWESVLRVNLTGAFNCTQKAMGLLREGGRIVNISSVSALAGFFGQANYSASKAGILALTKVTARELARQKITVNAVAPGFIKSELSAGMPEEVTKTVLAQIPLGDFGEVEDVVAAVLFLCSEESGYITGQVLNVNGGYYM